MSPNLSNVLEVLIGLAMLFFVLSLLVSTVNEVIIARWRGLRWKTLRAGIDSLVGSTTAANLYAHPLIRGLGDGRPSYIGSDLFSTVIVDLATNPGAAARIRVSAEQSFEEVDAALREAIASLPDDGARDALEALYHEALRRAATAEQLLDEFRASIERWFDAQMERISGWYKRNTQYWLLGLGLLLAVAINADSLHVVRTLYADDAARDSVVAAATKIVEAESQAGQQAEIPEQLGPALDAVAARIQSDAQSLDQAGIPVGWDQVSSDDSVYQWAWRVAGWLITALMLSFGSQFWFDVLNKLVSLRATGAPPPVPKSSSDST